MSKDKRDYLQDMLDYTQKIAEFTEAGREVFFLDSKTQFAVIRAYEVIGEIVKRLPEELLERQDHIQWKNIKAFRDFLSHNYDRVRLENIWTAVEQLPVLQEAIKALLEHIEQE
jgi:uncharacterized protein with HEPN domain